MGKIIVWQRQDAQGKPYLDLEVRLNAAFRFHYNEFEQGELIDRCYLLTAEGEHFRAMTEDADEDNYTVCELAASSGNS